MQYKLKKTWQITVILILMAISIVCIASPRVHALDQMKENDLDKITGQFGTAAAGDAAALSAPPADAAGHGQNLFPLAGPVSIAYDRYVEASDTNNTANDVSGFTRTITDTRSFISGAMFGLF